MEEFEVESNQVFAQAATNLTSVNSLESALQKFGYSKDDRINRRELVIMFRKIEKEMEDEIYRLAHTAAYDAAKEMRARLTSLRGEFDNLQTNGVRTVHRDQDTFFEQAGKELMENLSKRHSVEANHVEEFCDAARTDQIRFHEIEWENLELELSRKHLGPTKYSKRMIELQKAEHELIKLQQYEDARKVRRMIDKILPGEERAFQDKFQSDLEAKRTALREKQKIDDARLDEKLKSLYWKEVRNRERDATNQSQRLKNHDKDSKHMHVLESKLRPEMSVKPSALWQKRKGYETTSASLRGHQLLGSIRGKKEDEKVFADTLVDKHDFVNSLQDTLTLPQPDNCDGTNYFY